MAHTLKIMFSGMWHLQIWYIWRNVLIPLSE